MGGKTLSKICEDYEPVVEYNPECRLCPKLADAAFTVCMEGDGPSNADLMIVGEAPGEQEDELNRPFVGRAGEYLRDELLVPAGIPESKVRFTNAVRCHPKNNKTPSIGAIRKCRMYLEAEIKRINPKVIVGMGNVPLASFLHFFYSKGSEDGASKKTEAKVSGITKWQGKVIWLQEFQCWFIPTFHPSFCMRNEAQDSVYSSQQVISDLSKAWDLANRPRPNYPIPDAKVVDSSEGALSVIEEMRKNGVFAFDIETGGVGRALDKCVLGASFCCSEDRGYYIRWETLKDQKVYSKFISLVNDKRYKKIMHNGAYELRIFKFNGIPISDRYYDTMMAVHLLDENFSKGLKPNSWVMTRFGGYDVELEKYKSENKIVEDYSKIPDSMLTKYGAYDAIATWIIYKKTNKLLKEEGMKPLFDKIIMPVRRVLTNAEVTGMKVDIDRAAAVRDACKRAMDKLEGLVYSESGKTFNLNSTKQLSDVLYKDMKLPPLKKTISGWSCDKESIEYIKSKTDHPIAGYLSDRNYIKTMLTTHISQAIEFTWPEDGRIHTNYNSTGTVTGRISCIAEGTLVQTSRGEVPIEQVVSGDLVRSHTGEFRRVLRTLDQGVRPTYRLTTETSRQILCTSDHRFLTPSGWVCAENIEEVYCVGVKNIDEGQRVSEKSNSPVCQQSREAKFRRSGGYFEHHSTECLGRAEENVTRRETQGRSGIALLQKQGGEEKSDVWKNRREAPSLERGSSRWEGSFCTSGGRSVIPVSSCSICKVYGDAPIGVAGEFGSSPYRRGFDKQYYRQSCAMHTRRASEFAPEVESITSFAYVGEIQVYDLTVDVDESFIAGGFLVHNCSMPSLQNVPSDSLIRSLYIASPGNRLVEADLKSAEMALIAAISGEKTFIRSFEEGLDIHSETYRRIYDLPADYVCTKLQRRLAKTINFGLVYGISAIGLAARLGMSIEEAQEFIDLYFQRLPNVARWMEAQKDNVRKYGYVSSPFHRKRHLPGALSDKSAEVNRAQRQAMNSPIQSGAADYTYVGLIRLDRNIRDNHFEGKIVHSVHDCVVTDTPFAEIDSMTELVVSAFERSLKAVPIKMKAEVEVNRRWGEQNESKLQTILDGLKIVI